MQYIYGPVPSRRLGRSLGIDPIPLKTCNWNCVYCQLGRTKPLTNSRKEYYPRKEIIRELGESLSGDPANEIDWITIVGSGEPTLHSGLGWIIKQIKNMTDIPVAVITNGSLFYLPEVREALSYADVVLPSVDAGTEKLYRMVNRPHPEVTFQRLCDGLISFRKEFNGKIWVEVMLVKGLNDTEDALRDIKATMDQINPDTIHINIPVRPPVETWVHPPTKEGIHRAQAILGETAEVVTPFAADFVLGDSDDMFENLLTIISRHPICQEEIMDMLSDLLPDQIIQLLTSLKESGRARQVEREGKVFWVAAESLFPNHEKSMAAAPRELENDREVE